MKKTSYSILFLSVIAFSFSLAVSAVATTGSLAQSLSGRILLQVESKGEAWYVDPQTHQRYYLGRPHDAFAVMRTLGLGISNTDLLQIASSESQQVLNQTFAKNLSGRILLQVESKGEAWYINPTDLRRYYLGRPNDAFAIMRNLGLGISNQDLETIAISGQSSMPQMVLAKIPVEEKPVISEETVPVQDVIVPAPVVPEPIQVAINHPVLVNGDDTCRQQAQSAMDLLYYEAKSYYEFFTSYIGIIDCTPDQSGVYVTENPARFEAGWPTRSAGQHWFASVLVHEACHVWQYQRYGAMPVPVEEYYGRDAETECTQVQKEAAVTFGADQDLIDYMDEVLEFAWWDVDYEERYW